MRASSWLRHALPVVAVAAFAAAIFEPAEGEPLRLGARVREAHDGAAAWEGRYLGRTEGGLYVLKSGKVLVLAERREFVPLE